VTSGELERLALQSVGTVGNADRMVEPGTGDVGFTCDACLVGARNQVLRREVLWTARAQPATASPHAR
jgi:hypothetical protein